MPKFILLKNDFKKTGESLKQLLFLFFILKLILNGIGLLQRFE
jgi:hypothetical protein